MAWSGARFNDFRQSITKGPVNLSDSKQSNPSWNASSNSVGQLEQLNEGSIADVIGVVIAKEDSKSIFSKKSQGKERFLLSFTIRDSPDCFCNCTCWGGEQFIKDLAQLFTIGDVVKIEKAHVQQNPTDGSDEKFRVSTPLPFHLTLSEKHSSLTLYTGLDLDTYTSLQHIPTKASSDYYTLEDVLANDQNLNGQHINVLAAVRKVGPAKDITTKTGKFLKRCEIKLFDESCSSFPLILWGVELVNYAQTWSPYETVVFVADVRMNYDHYRNGMVATSDSKTVFTLNPDTVDARCLYQFAQTQNFCGDMETEFTDPPLDEIKDVKTVSQITNCEETAYAILYGIITKFDLDADNPDQFFVKKCARCKKRVTESSGYKCQNCDCNLGALQMYNTTGQVTLEEPEQDFRMSICVSDHTGTLSVCITANIIENMTGMKTSDLFSLAVHKRTDMKWHYLLERCKLHVKIQRSFRDQEKSNVRLLSCCRADTREMENSIAPFHITP